MLYIDSDHSFCLLTPEKCDLELTDDQKMFLTTVTAFNINARYDDYKMSFQQKCTPEFTATWIGNLKINRQ